MKDYTPEERIKAKKQLPKPVLEFLLSPTLENIYLGIQKKHTLNFRQLTECIEIANLTLTGLEPQSALETNLHQAMHELSNEGTKELVADLSDRVFKEAQRRLRENVSEPSELSKAILAPELTPEEKAEHAKFEALKNMDDDDPHLLAAYKEDEAMEEKRKAKADEEEKKVEEEYAKRHAEIEAKAKTEAESTQPTTQNVEPAGESSEFRVQSSDKKNETEIKQGVEIKPGIQKIAPITRDVKEVLGAPHETYATLPVTQNAPARPKLDVGGQPAAPQTISREKLGVPTLVKPVEVQGESGVPKPPAAAQTKPRDGVDQYRERPD